MRAFRRVAIVNRGEAAMRFIRAAREVQVEQGSPLTTIALYTDAERNAMFVREADEAVRIYSAGQDAYLDYDVLEQALRDSAADAVWVGWGFVSEDPEFADRVEKMGLVFIGPSGSVMRALGDKIGAKRLAERAGVPVAPWSGGPVTSAAEAHRHAGTIGYPLMIKAAAGGGGRGIRSVQDARGLDAALDSARREAVSSFGDGTLLMERMIAGGRHVEVQIAADGQGGVWALGVRDCSLQRRHQKVIEESASTALDARGEQRAKAAAVTLAEVSGYCGVASVEFLYQPGADLLVFLEVNTRLQVEHAVTELTTGVDLVKLQLDLAGGGTLAGQPPGSRGHAIEVRLNAEDPERDFAPAPGTVEYLAWATGPGVRIETGLAQGEVIPAEYDSMIAKVIGYGRNRYEAHARVVRALRETTVVIAGGTTNKAFLAGLLEHPDVVAGRFDTAWLERLMSEGYRPPPGLRAVALASAAIDAYDSNREIERGRFFLSAVRGRPQTEMAFGHRVDLLLGGASYPVEVYQIGAGRYRLLADGVRVDVDAEPGGPFERRLVIAGGSFRVVSIRQGTETLVEVDGLPHRVSQDDGGLVRAPSPGVLVHIAVQDGDEVAAGDHLATLESMKMEVALRAPASGWVREVLAAVGAPVTIGSPVFRLETKPEGPVLAGSAGRADFAALAGRDSGDPRTRVAQILAELRSQVLGYDYSEGEARRIVAAYREHRPQLAPGDTGTLRLELAVLDGFTDLVLLSRNRRIGVHEAAEAVHSPREFFHAFLGTMDLARAGLPSSFADKLRQAVAGYQVDGLERTPALEEALFWMFLAQQRNATLLPAVLAILGFLLEHLDGHEELREELLGTLDRMILATQLRHPVAGTLARRVRFRLFDGPLIQAGQDETLAVMREQLSIMAGTGTPQDRAASMDVLLSCPLPLTRMMAAPDQDEAERRALIEVQTRRFYQIGDLAGVRCFDLDGRRMVTGTFEQAGERVAIVAADAPSCEPADLAGVMAAIGTEAGAAGGGFGVSGVFGVADVYVRAAGPASERELAAGIAGALAATPLPDGLRRVTVSVPTGAGELTHSTFERDGAGFAENLVLGDLHPMVAERLHLWRLAQFGLRRVAAPDDVYLFEATALANVADRRLIALAEVRDLTPLRDAAGSVTAIPALELVLDSCLAGIRRAMAESAWPESPQWNRIVLYAWPDIELGQDELLSVLRTLAPRTGSTGLEQLAIQGRIRAADGTREVRLRMARSAGAGLTFAVTPAPTGPLHPLDGYTQLVLRARRRGTVYPYELIPLLLGHTGAFSAERGAARAEFREYDLDGNGQARAVDRPYGENKSAIVFGTVTTPTVRYPEGMTRVVILGDPTKALGSVSEPECRRLVAAIDLATSLGTPVEWLAVSAGAKIAMDSGTENMDWVARVLRRLITFTQAGGEINVVVTGINVGAQSYWNAEATMLMHTKGILVMTPDSAMVLTGKQSLEYSGGVAAEDNFGIGGYDRIMGPNGQAQYWAQDIAEAARILLAHYDVAYVAPGERFGRRARTEDPLDRDVRQSPHHVEGLDFTTIGEIFSAGTNAERKKAFDIRALMKAVIDRDGTPLERWAGMADADTAVVFDAFLGGYPVALIGIESRPLPRLGLPPTDGPELWSGGTLFPRSSKKVARAINAASDNRPVVVLANLSGFDGSPESLRRLQLEYGAEIGRAVVNFAGPIVFCVVSRYHGGAFVVFSGALNDGLEVAAVNGSYASVIGGGPAAAVVFGGEVRKRTEADRRMVELRARIVPGEDGEARLRAELERLRAAVHAEKQAEVAGEFDRIHSIERAKLVGSVDRIIAPGELRPYLVAAVERGISRFGTLPAPGLVRQRRTWVAGAAGARSARRVAQRAQTGPYRVRSSTMGIMTVSVRAGCGTGPVNSTV
jgi:acetyl/propionyl-CoA carboxylase alpha subunit/acetyl-CoA carboxylase carboxyltransferase component